MTTKTPSSDVETSVAEMNGLAADITSAVDSGLRSAPGSDRRNLELGDALAGLEHLEAVVRALRTAVENLP